MAGKSPQNKKVGILALQGDIEIHANRLSLLGIKSILVKSTGQLKNLDGLIIPGGESTALLKLAKAIGMIEAIEKFYQNGGKIFGTCAGAILLAKSVSNPAQESLGLIDISIERNGYGRQLQSLETVGHGTTPLPTKLSMTFIRAPRIKKIGNAVKVLAKYQNEAVLVEQERILVATFHPELTDDSAVYEYWLNKL